MTAKPYRSSKDPAGFAAETGISALSFLAEDAARGRLYLPRDLLDKHGIASHAPDDVLRDAKLPGVCRDMAAIAQTHYTKADAFMAKCSSAAMSY